MPCRTLSVASDHDVLLTLRQTVGKGRGLSYRVVGGEHWRATRTPEGPAAIRIGQRATEVEAEAWGAGADWALEHLPGLIGALDEVPDFGFETEPLRTISRRLRGLRVPRTLAVFEALVPDVLAQKVTGREAAAGYSALSRKLAEPAPGPLELMLPPDPKAIAAMGYEEFHPLGIERRRANVLRFLGKRVRRVEETIGMDIEAARERLLAFPGIGPWTVGKVSFSVFGDPDAVHVGDYHLPSWISWNLAGEPRAKDPRMLELLEPYRGQRGRIVRWLELGGSHPPRYGPRTAVRKIEGM